MKDATTPTLTLEQRDRIRRYLNMNISTDYEIAFQLWLSEDTDSQSMSKADAEAKFLAEEVSVNKKEEVGNERKFLNRVVDGLTDYTKAAVGGPVSLAPLG